MARIKSEFLHQYHARHGAPRRARLLSRAESMAVWGSRLAPLSNWMAQSHWARWLNEKMFGLDRRRRPPVFARRTFLDWWNKRRHDPRHAATEGSSRVALFADTFTNYYEPRHAMAAVRIAERLGVHVVVPPRVCCGRPLISKGFLDQAARQAAATVEILTPLAEQGVPLVFCEPSCYSAVRDDHPHLLRGQQKEQAEKVAKACLTFEQWADSALKKWTEQTKTESESYFQPGPARVLLHGHCHQKALTGMEETVRLLSHIPGCAITNLDSGCCGMAGSFGYEMEHYGISQAVGERKLLPAVRECGSDTVVVAPGFSCRHQIRHFTDVEALSPMELLVSLLPKT